MTTTLSSLRDGPVGANGAPPPLAVLERALKEEKQLLGQLSTILLQQRDGIVRDDLGAVDDSIFSAQRVVLTLGEAYQRRQELLRIITGVSGVSLEDVEDVLGGMLSDGMIGTLRELEEMAGRVSRDVAINRHVLQRALESCHEYVQALACAVSPNEPVYGPDNAPEGESRSCGTLIDRQV